MNRFYVLVYIILFGSTLLFGGFGALTLSSDTHDITKKNIFKSTNITISWNTPSTTDSSVLGGYYYVLDKNRIISLDDTNNKLGSEANDISIDSSSNGDGDYYFHIAPFGEHLDSVIPAHFGPIKIDTTRPSEPVISPGGGSHSTLQSVSITSSDTNTYKIYYTLDGTTPTASSTLYSDAIEVGSAKTLQAISIDGAGNESPIKISSFIFSTSSNLARFGDEVSANDVIATNINGGSTSFKNSLSIQGDGITHYKVKFNEGGFSAQKSITQKIDLTSLNEGVNTIYIIGSSGGTTFQNENEASSLRFTIDNTAPENVVFSSTGGEITSSTTISLSSTGSSNIYYTKDGSSPDSTKTKSSTISLTNTDNGTRTLKAISYDLAGNKSNIKTEVYSVNIASSSSGGGGSSSGGGGGGGGGSITSSPTPSTVISIDESLKTETITNESGKQATSITIGKINIQTHINDSGNRVNIIKSSKGETTNITSSIQGSKVKIEKDGTFAIDTPSVISESKKIFQLSIAISPDGAISGILSTTLKDNKNKTISTKSNIPNYSTKSTFMIEQKGNDIILSVVSNMTNNKITF